MEQKKEKKDLSKKFWYIVITISIVLIILIAIGFALFANSNNKVIDTEENGGNIVLNYTSNVNGLQITGAVPTTDAVGMINSEDGKYFDFSVNVKLDEASSIEYEISVVKDKANSTISDDDIRIYLEKEKSGTYTKVFAPAKFTGIKEESDLGSKKGSMILTSSKAIKNTTDNYRLRMWLSDKSLLTSGSYSIEIEVNGTAQ
jgi:uncharacterized protein YpmB